MADAGILASEIETPSEYEEKSTVADNFMLAMPGIGFKLRFSSAKLAPGHGFAVCTILDALLRQSLKKRRFAPSGFRRVSDLGSEQEMETVSGEGEGIIDDAVDVDEPDDDGVADVWFDADTAKVVNGLELQKVERVAERLQIQIFAAKSDWRSHFAMMGQHDPKITELMAQLAPILPKVGAGVTRAVESIQTREKALNTRFQATISEYAAPTASLEQIEKQYQEH